VLSRETHSPGERARAELLADPVRTDAQIAEAARVSISTAHRIRRLLEHAGMIAARPEPRPPVPFPVTIPPIAGMPRMPELEDGLCTRHPDPDLWCSDIWADRERAVSVCLRCPVQLACLQWALSLPPGAIGAVYGGLRPAQLARLRRDRQRESA
jgi:Transcription factor WhiB